MIDNRVKYCLSGLEVQSLNVIEKCDKIFHALFSAVLCAMPKMKDVCKSIKCGGWLALMFDSLRVCY